MTQTISVPTNHEEMVAHMLKSYTEAAFGAVENKNNKVNNNRLILASNFLYNLIYLYKDRYGHLHGSQQSLMSALLRATSFPGRIYFGLNSQIAIWFTYRDFRDVLTTIDEETLQAVVTFMDKNTKYSHYTYNGVATTRRPVFKRGKK